MRLVLALLAVVAASSSTAQSVALTDAQLAVVKVYGAGGAARLEGYQTGVFLAGLDAVLTVDSAVLDAFDLTLIDAYGDRHTGRVVSRDTNSGLALIEYPAASPPPAALTFQTDTRVATAQSLWVLSNAFDIAVGDEPVTVQRARLAATGPIPLGPQAGVRPRPGVPRPGTTVLLLDAITSNPGTSGGIVIDRGGAAVGVIGAECRSSKTGAWINYALPATAVVEAIDRMASGARDDGVSPNVTLNFRWRPTVREHGLAMLPSLVDRTPAYVEAVDRGSLAARAGLRPDDLLVAVDGVTVSSVEAAGAAVARGLSTRGEVEVTTLRGRSVVTVTLSRGAP